MAPRHPAIMAFSIMTFSITTLSIKTLSITTLSIIDLKRLHHSPDDSTFPRFELTCFVYIICFSKR
jgi:hypothetical protein